MQVFSIDDLRFIGASVRGEAALKSAGLAPLKASSFSISLDPLDTATCLGAPQIDIHWRIKRPSIFSTIFGNGGPLSAEIHWSPLYVALAKDTIEKRE